MPWTTGAASLYVEKKKAQSSPALQRSPKHRSSSSSSLSLVFDLSVKKRTFRFFLRIEASQPTSLFLSTNRLSSSPSATAAASSSSAARRPVHRYFQVTLDPASLPPLTPWPMPINSPGTCTRFRSCSCPCSDGMTGSSI